MPNLNLEQAATHGDWDQDRLDRVQEQLAAQAEHFADAPTTAEQNEVLVEYADNTKAALASHAIDAMALDPNMSQERLDAIRANAKQNANK